MTEKEKIENKIKELEKRITNLERNQPKKELTAEEILKKEGRTQSNYFGLF
jgi:CRISPR/Cas system-associated endonuclease Cas1